MPPRSSTTTTTTTTTTNHTMHPYDFLVHYIANAMCSLKYIHILQQASKQAIILLPY